MKMLGQDSMPRLNLACKMKISIVRSKIRLSLTLMTSCSMSYISFARRLGVHIDPELHILIGQHKYICEQLHTSGSIDQRSSAFN